MPPDESFVVAFVRLVCDECPYQNINKKKFQKHQRNKGQGTQDGARIEENTGQVLQLAYSQHM